jgi:hypothetical protein
VDGGNRQGSATGIGQHDVRRDEQQRGSLEFEEAVSQCAIPSRLGSPNSPPQLEDRGQKFPDSLDVSVSDRTQLRGWIAQLRRIIRYKPTSFPDEQSKTRYAFNRLSTVALKQVLPYVQVSGEIGLEELPAFI